jgi:hypothetical protein
MTGTRRIWLVVNEASGSNDSDAHDRLERTCSDAGFVVERVIAFPEQALPAPAALDAAGIDLVAVFAGDGTVNALIGHLTGWSGAVLVLPGGTMNLLYHRLHGAREMDEVVRLAAADEAKPARPGVIACRHGTALVDLLAGPVAGWFDLRESMRAADLLGVADSAAQAIGETLATPGIACRDPELGLAEGYPLVMLSPTEAGIAVSGYHADTPAEVLKASWALLRHRFREGPHDQLGQVGQVTLASTAGEPFGLLIDGERFESAGEEQFRLVPCAVDLLATQADGR